MKNLYVLLLGVALGLTPRPVMSQCDDFDPQTFTHTVNRVDDPTTLVQENWDWRNADSSNWQQEGINSSRPLHHRAAVLAGTGFF